MNCPCGKDEFDHRAAATCTDWCAAIQEDRERLDKLESRISTLEDKVAPSDSMYPMRDRVSELESRVGR